MCTSLRGEKKVRSNYASGRKKSVAMSLMVDFFFSVERRLRQERVEKKHFEAEKRKTRDRFWYVTNVYKSLNQVYCGFDSPHIDTRSVEKVFFLGGM